MTPCAGCPSPILPAPVPRFSEVVLGLNADDGTAVVSLDEYHPGCWAAELRRHEAEAEACP